MMYSVLLLFRKRCKDGVVRIVILKYDIECMIGNITSNKDVYVINLI